MSEGQITGSILVSSDAKNTDTNQEISKSGIIIKNWLTYANNDLDMVHRCHVRYGIN